MAVIDQYTSRVLAQGQIDSRANGADFGAGVGQAMESVGSGLQDVGQALYQREVSSEVAKVHVQMAEARPALQQIMNDEVNKTQPGDETFVPRVQASVENYFKDKSSQFQTRQAQNLFSTMSADMKGMYGVNAVEEQSRMAGQAAKTDFTKTTNALGTAAAQDYSQVDSLIKQGAAAIDDPNGPYAKVPQTTRDALKQDQELNIRVNAAKGFARRYPNAVLGALDPETRGKVQAVIANPPVPGVVPDLQAPTVKPYTQSNVSRIAAVVAAPSPYDKEFEAAARQFNLDPKELKLRAVVESGLNPTAVSSQNAGGIMQFTPEMAAQLGVDRNDPKAAIFAAAKLLAGYRTKANGDMAVVDKMYYGGASGTGWGANTNQYAANLSAARQAVGLGSSVPPEAFAPSATVQLTTDAATGQPAAPGAPGQTGEFKKAKTGIALIDNLPAAQFFDVLTEAEHYQRAMDTQSERARMEAERQKKTAQDQTMNTYMTGIITPSPEKPSPSETQIMQDATLSWEQKQHLVDYKMRRERELTAGAESKSNPAEVRGLMLQIHAADDDPSKSYNLDPVMESYKAGKISTNEMVFLRREVEQMKDGTTQGFQKDIQSARNAVYTALTRSIIGQVQPEVAADAAYRFNADMELKIAAMRKENKDPRTLLDPASRDYLLKPERIQSFMPHGPTAGAEGAAKVAQAQAPSLPKVSSQAEYDALPKGTSYTDPAGNVRTKK